MRTPSDPSRLETGPARPCCCSTKHGCKLNTDLLRGKRLEEVGDEIQVQIKIFLLILVMATLLWPCIKTGAIGHNVTPLGEPLEHLGAPQLLQHGLRVLVLLLLLLRRSLTLHRVTWLDEACATNLALCLSLGGFWLWLDGIEKAIDIEIDFRIAVFRRAVDFDTLERRCAVEKRREGIHHVVQILLRVVQSVLFLTVCGLLVILCTWFLIFAGRWNVVVGTEIARLKLHMSFVDARIKLLRRKIEP